MFTVWQPMLATDLAPPITAVRSRVSDRRAVQYWDREHLLAKRMAADARAPQAEEECCRRNGILWDIVAIYPKGALWNERMPPASFFNGPVIDVSADIEHSVRNGFGTVGP